MKNIITLLAIGGALLASCSLLDTEPQDFVSPENYYNNEEEMNAALNGVYATLANTTLFGGNLLGRMGLSADIGYESYSSDYGSVGDYDVAPTDAKILTYWRDLYDGIGRANMLMKYIDKPQLEQTTRDNIYGQALFLRAYYHFLLVVRFHNIPLVLTVPENGKKEQVQHPQSSMRDVYLRIIEDMETAAEMVPPAAELQSPGRVSRSTVYGMLARAALYMAGYPLNEPGMYAKAKEYAQKVIDTGTHALNPSYQELFLNYIQDRYDTAESLFEVEFYGTNEGTYTTTAGMVGRNNGIGCSSQNVTSSGQTVVEMYGYSIGAIRTTPYFYGLFEEGDLRRDWTIASYTYNTTTGEKSEQTSNIWVRYCGKFRREYELTTPRATNYTPINFPLLRYADVLLIWAEGVAADPSNNDGEELRQAYEYVNQVRRRGYGLDIYAPSETADLEQGDKSILLDVIKDERAREFGFELLRKDDIVRWGEFYDRMRYMRSVAAGIPDTFTSSYYVNARRYYNSASRRDEIWPIPTYELGVNRNLVQNNGW
ncbi:MAG: RagB/SusD family nutrient uptake outer membrane protein [Alistipes sp.]|nr:RagB/SusD family nutrient uptake outer membrane protein [Alistipes sp.]